MRFPCQRHTVRTQALLRLSLGALLCACAAHAATHLVAKSPSNARGQETAREQATLATIGAAVAGARPGDTILVQNGHYCGRRFTCGRLQAIWFVEEGELKFYGEDGSVFKMTTSDAVTAPGKRAA